MTRGKGGIKRSLTLGEKADLLSQKQEAEAQLKELETYGQGTAAEAIDKTKLKKEAERLGNYVDEHSVPNVRGVGKDRLAQEAEVLKGEFMKNLPTRYEMDHPARCPGAVHKHLKWSQKNEPAVRRYKEIMRTIEPDDPTAGDIEKLRMEK